MNLDEQGVGSGGDRGERHGGDEVAMPGTLAGVGDDRQVRELLHQRNRADVHRIARHFLKGANAPLAQDNIGVALRENVFRRQQPLFDGGRHAAFEYDRLIDAPDLVQQEVVLHVARADLQNVGVLAYHIYIGRRHDLGNDRHAEGVTGLRQQFQAILAHTAKTIGRCRGLESATAQDHRAVFAHRFGSGHQLLLALYRAWTGHHDDRAASDTRYTV